MEFLFRTMCLPFNYCHFMDDSCANKELSIVSSWLFAIATSNKNESPLCRVCAWMEWSFRDDLSLADGDTRRQASNKRHNAKAMGPLIRRMG